MQIFASLHCATFEGIFGAKASDASLDLACLTNIKTGVGMKRYADQNQTAFVASVFLFFNTVETLIGHNPTEEISFINTIEKLSKIAIT